jgi:hypothetical protein
MKHTHSFRTVLLLSWVLLFTRPWWSPGQETGDTPVFKPEEIEQIVAPIALYPGSLVAQVLMASTYPLEVVEAARWAKDNPDLKGDAYYYYPPGYTCAPSRLLAAVGV